MTHEIVHIPSSDPVDQARALRMVLAYIDDDLAQLTAVAAEVAVDQRGMEVAFSALSCSLAASLAHVWLERAAADDVVASIRRGLIAFEGGRS